MFRTDGVPVGPALLKPVFFGQGLRGRENDRAPQRADYLQGRGPLKRPLTQAGYMTATVLSQLGQEGLARERGPYMTAVFSETAPVAAAPRSQR